MNLETEALTKPLSLLLPNYLLGEYLNEMNRRFNKK